MSRLAPLLLAVRFELALALGPLGSARYQALRSPRSPRRALPFFSAKAFSSSYAPLATLEDNLEEAWAKFPQTWVPLASTFELDPERPTPVKFLGRPYVVWLDNGGAWRAFVDACPHRLAPLSEGRIDRASNSLECSYHGWAFEPSGSCARIPQAEGAALAAGLSSPRSCVQALPVALHKTVLFVWPWGGLPTLSGHGTPESMLASAREGASTYTRDLPYGWDTLLENLVDPAHVPFAHHGMQGSRADALPINMTLSASASAAPDASGFSFDFADRTMGMRRAGSGHFRAPFVISYAADFEPKPGAKRGAQPRPFDLSVVCIPTRPGWSRAIIFGAPAGDKAPKRRVAPLPAPVPAAAADAKKKKETKSLFASCFGLLPVWVVHVLSNRFLDSDLAFLHYQEKEVARRGTLDYFMPSPSDKPIAALRRWLAAHAAVPGPLPPPEPRRATLMDRWEQHGAHCAHCTAAADGIGRWRKNAVGTLALSALLGWRLWPARLVAASCILTLYALGLLEEQLQFQDFKHYTSH